MAMKNLILSMVLLALSSSVELQSQTSIGKNNQETLYISGGAMLPLTQRRAMGYYADARWISKSTWGIGLRISESSFTGLNQPEDYDKFLCLAVNCDPRDVIQQSTLYAIKEFPLSKQFKKLKSNIHLWAGPSWTRHEEVIYIESTELFHLDSHETVKVNSDGLAFAFGTSFRYQPVDWLGAELGVECLASDAAFLIAPHLGISIGILQSR